MSRELGNKNLGEPLTIYFTAIGLDGTPTDFDGSSYAITLYKGDGNTTTNGVTNNASSSGLARVDIATTHADYIPEDYTAVITTGVLTDGSSLVGQIVGSFSLDKKYDGLDIWYVDTGGSDSYHGHTRGAAKATLSAAITASSNGDTIYLLPGTHDVGTGITVTKSLNLIGDNPTTTIIDGTDDSAHLLDWNISGWSMKNLSLTLAHTSAEATSHQIDATSSQFWTLENVVFGPTQQAHGLDCSNGNQGIIRRCFFNTLRYAILADGMFDLQIEDSRFTMAPTATLATTQTLIHSSSTTRMYAKGTRFGIAHTTGSYNTARMSIIDDGAIMSFARCDLSVTKDTGSGIITPIYTNAATNSVLMNNCRIRSTNSGTGDEFNVECDAGFVQLNNCDFEPTLLGGTTRSQISVDGGVV